jgi:Tfp pilus assembly protein PilE
MIAVTFGVILLLIAVLAYDGWVIGRSRLMTRRRRRPVVKTAPAIERRVQQRRVSRHTTQSTPTWRARRATTSPSSSADATS